MEEEVKQKKPGSPEEEEVKPKEAGGGGWGGWGVAPFSMLSDLHKAASVAAVEISRNASAIAKDAAKSISDVQAAGPDSGSVEEDGTSEEVSPSSKSEEVEKDKIRKSALEKLEKAGEDSLFGQGLKALDTSVETFASGAWNSLGSAWRGGSDLIQKLEHSAANLADSIQHSSVPMKGGAFGPSILESGKTITAKGMEMLELVGKETMELLIPETALEVERSPDKIGQLSDEQFEEVTFDRCFYIYGGPDHLEELEALSNHHALLFNRRKAKLAPEQKSFYNGKLKEVQEIFSMGTAIEDIGVELDKGKDIQATEEVTGNELRILCDASIRKAADMATGFAAALGGLAANEVIHRTESRLEGIHSEGIHRISELCCFAISHIVVLGKSAISNANKSNNEDVPKDFIKFDWPEDSAMKAKIIRSKAQVMTGDVEAVCDGFITGVSDIIEACAAAMKGASVDANETQQAPVQEKARAISELIRTGQQTALDKIQDALQYLAYVVLSTSMPVA